MNKSFIRSITPLTWLTIPVVCILLTHCGIPDITNQEVLEEAKAEAISLNSLDRKLMYGMIQLYVDRTDTPYTGWVKEEYPPAVIKRLGYVKDGQKEGTWLSWHLNGQLESQINWHNDRYSGHFQAWHPNGRVKAIGQTKEGEMDGKWVNFYQSGVQASESISEVGLAVSASVWMPDGQPCKKTDLKDGDGTLYQYEENGSIQKVTLFQNGIGTLVGP
jgi:antitoxin component YwqK of YwqJK toxin-antitoxin module